VQDDSAMEHSQIPMALKKREREAIWVENPEEKNGSL